MKIGKIHVIYVYIKNQKQTDELPKSQVGYGLGEVCYMIVPLNDYDKPQCVVFLEYIFIVISTVVFFLASLVALHFTLLALQH